jgi:Rad3-related DNA helicase
MEEPRHYGIPHGSWRKHQYETLQELRKAKQGDVIIVQAPTGSGKTALAAALACENDVIALAQTKLLQEENYGGIYGFDYLFGKGNYHCPFTKQTASSCKFVRGPARCNYNKNSCEYHIRKRAAIASKKCSLNYAYFLTAKWPSKRAEKGYLVLDECHLLPDLVLEHSSITLTEFDRRLWRLPTFPSISSRASGVNLFNNNPTEEAASWLGDVYQVMRDKVSQLEKEAEHDDSRQGLLGQAKDLMYRVDATLTSLNEKPMDWFIRSGRWARSSYNGHSPGFICKPLTARHHFPSRFLLGGKVILMSATVGNFRAFAEELGIPDYKSIRVPSQWEPSKRPVYYHSDAPSIGQKTTRAGYNRQAEIIAAMLRSVPSSWSGVIHCTSKQQAKDLAGRLAQSGFGKRIWLPASGQGTNTQIASWHETKKRQQNALAITWAWWVGVNLLEEKIAITAKTPFPFIGADYGRARMMYDGKFYLQRTAWRLMQGCGRTRRGRPQDYDSDGQKAGLVAVVDSNWKRVRKYMDDDFLESMTQWD